MVGIKSVIRLFERVRTTCKLDAIVENINNHNIICSKQSLKWSNTDNLNNAFQYQFGNILYILYSLNMLTTIIIEQYMFDHSLWF